MKTFTLHLPDTLDLDATEATTLLATRLYEQGKLSLGLLPRPTELPPQQGLGRGLFHQPEQEVY